MDGIVVFQSSDGHPLCKLLKGGFQHVWCATHDPERGWSSFDWRMGSAHLRMEASAHYRLADHYRREGYTVLDVQCGDMYSCSPIILNNCVGYVKLIMGIQSWALTPHQLYRHLTKKERPTMWSRIKQFVSLPGFGSSAPAAPAAPAPLPDPPKKTDEAVQQARRDEVKRAKARAGTAGTINTPLGGVGDATTTKTLLGQ